MAILFGDTSTSLHTVFNPPQQVFTFAAFVTWIIGQIFCKCASDCAMVDYYEHYFVGVH